MRIGFISDIHSNYEALDVAMSKLLSEDVDRVICLGDIVGYGADPSKCVDIVGERADVVLAGNHDWACVGKTDITYFTRYGRQAILWTSDALLPHQKTFLAQLNLFYTEDDWCAVHSTPQEPSRWQYILSSADAMRQFTHFRKKICFVGHSHIPGVFTDRGDYMQISIPFNEESTQVVLSQSERYIVNVGSVGQPRDGDVRGSAAIYDTDKAMIKFLRFFYPVPKAQEKIIAAGLPSFLAERLSQGI